MSDTTCPFPLSETSCQTGRVDPHYTARPETPVPQQTGTTIIDPQPAPSSLVPDGPAPLLSFDTTTSIIDIGDPPTLPTATTLAQPTPSAPPAGLPRTGTSSGLILAAAIITIAGSVLRRTARRGA